MLICSKKDTCTAFEGIGITVCKASKLLLLASKIVTSCIILFLRRLVNALQNFVTNIAGFGAVGLLVQIKIDFVGGFVYALNYDFDAIAQAVFDTAIC